MIFSKSMNKLISICIPTCDRPFLLQEALESCCSQEYDSIEIIIGDDSKNNSTEKLIKNLQLTAKHKIHYIRNTPPLGQARNVNMLFDMAQGDRLVLLHDDDLLLPNAIVDLDKCWQIEPGLTAAFGKQYIISMLGEILLQESENLNRSYYRTANVEGLQASAVVSGLLQQFPNNGYMVLSAAAKSIKYRDRNIVGDACDQDFGIRLGMAFDKFYFLNKYTSKYRITTTSSVSNKEDCKIAEFMYPMIEALSLPESSEYARKCALKNLAPLAIKSYALQGRKKEAWNIYFSENFSLIKRAAPGGIYLLLLSLLPVNFSKKILQAQYSLKLKNDSRIKLIDSLR
jgi:glycosyltransferase involved in cell wall biosynthesis